MVIGMDNTIIKTYYLFYLIASVHGVALGYNETSSCFWNINNTRLYSALNQTTADLSLDCSGLPESVIHVVSAEYKRPVWRGDQHCFNTSDLGNCCENGWWNTRRNNRYRMCRVPLEEELMRMLEMSCNGKAFCTVGVQAVHLDDCQNLCDFNVSQGISEIRNNWCWARLVQANFLCELSAVEDPSPSTDCDSGLGVEIVAGIPISFVAGVCLGIILLKCCWKQPASEKEEAKDNIKPGMTPSTTTESVNMDNEEELDTYHAIRDSDLFRVRSTKRRMSDIDPGVVGKFAHMTPSKTRLSIEDPIHEERSFGMSSSTQGEINKFMAPRNGNVQRMPKEMERSTDETKFDGDYNGVSLVVNDEYVVLAETDTDMINNETYEATPPVNPSGELNGKLGSGDEVARKDNYVYTYGHFTLEGRSREPSVNIQTGI